MTVLVLDRGAGEASACPNCKEAVSLDAGEVSNLSSGYNWSVVFMLAVPFSLLGTGAFMVRRAVDRGRSRRCKRNRRDESPCGGNGVRTVIRPCDRHTRPTSSARRVSRPALVLAARSSIMSRTACSTAACQSPPNRA